jgi:predicted ATPase
VIGTLPGVTTERLSARPGGGAFIGRTREVEAIDRSFDDGARIVTITGAAGMGKTRLALEWARRARAGREALDRDGASLFFCDLSEARDIDDVCAVVARAFAAPLAAAATADEIVAQLGRALAESGLSVVLLDNLEQLVAIAPRLLIPWLTLAPGAQFLVTSRERLRLDEEVCIELEPLSVPAADEREAGAIASSEAVELFVARTRAVRRGFELTEADAESVASIVRRVDGIPLAIELCAARMGVLAPQQLLARLARRFDLLVSGARGAPARKATLRGAIDSSWDLLDPWEKRALAQCSVFAGGFSLEAAEAVLDLRATASDDDAPAVLDVLQSLHDKSLVRAFDAPGEPAARRYGLLESIREYAEERLDELGETAAGRDRHATFYLDLSGPRGSALPRLADVASVSLEVDNLMAVCTRALARSPLLPADADAALRGLLLLEPVLLMCAKGRLEPYVAMLDAALEIEAAPIDRIVRARALYTRALADLLRGRMLDCALSFQRALDEARAAGSRPDQGLALTKIALMLDLADRPDEARACFEEARAIATDLGEPALHADWMLTTAGGLIWRGRTANAAWYAEQAVEGFRIAGDRRGGSMACAQVALTHLSLGRFDEAEIAAQQALALARASSDRRTEGYVLGILGRLQQVRAELDDARATMTAALAIHRAVGDRWSEGVLHGFLGNVAFEAGLLDDARVAYGEAVAKLRGTGERHYSAIFLGALGAVELGLGRVDEATARFEEASARLDGVRVLSTRVTVDLYCGHADLERARRAAASGDAGAEERHLRAAAAKIARAQAPAGDGAPAPMLCAEDVRFAVRLLERAIAAPARAGESAAATRAPSRPTLIVGPEARWFRVGEQPTVLVLKAQAGRLVLARLVRCHIDAPGRALSLGDLFEAGWPGERIAPKAAANRVYVTLTKLRQLGLGKLIQSRDDGFVLDPAAVVLEALDHEPPMSANAAARSGP